MGDGFACAVDLGPAGLIGYRASEPSCSPRGEWNCWLWIRKIPAPILIEVDGHWMRTASGAPKTEFTGHDLLCAWLWSIAIHLRDLKGAARRARLSRRSRPDVLRTRRDRAAKCWGAR